jgi:hypothetical protein
MPAGRRSTLERWPGGSAQSIRRCGAIGEADVHTRRDSWHSMLCLGHRITGNSSQTSSHTPLTAIGARQRGSLAARAQQGDRAWRIGVLLAGDENDHMAKPRISAFTHALAELGWVDGTKRADGPSLGRHRQQSDRSARGRVGRPARHHLGKLGPGDRCRPAGEADAGPASVFMLEGIPRSARFIAPSPQTRP